MARAIAATYASTARTRMILKYRANAPGRARAVNRCAKLQARLKFNIRNVVVIIIIFLIFSNRGCRSLARLHRQIRACVYLASSNK